MSQYPTLWCPKYLSYSAISQKKLTRVSREEIRREALEPLTESTQIEKVKRNTVVNMEAGETG